jgi:hypothetical protein
VTSPKTVRRWMNGETEPSYRQGEILLALHRLCVTNPPDPVPSEEEIDRILSAVPWIDWRLVVRQIQTGYLRDYEVSLTEYKLGLMVNGADKKAVRAWLRGKEPTHRQGQLLLHLHRQFHRTEREDANGIAA